MSDNRRVLLDILTEIRPEHDFANSENFVEDGMLDSLDIVTLVVRLEQEFGISIDGADIRAENFRNLASLETLIERGREGL